MASFLELDRYFAFGVDPDAALTSTYDPLLVLASFFVAALAGYSFVGLMHRIAGQEPSPARSTWMVVGSVIMGVGIWAMHFIGMLAYRLPVEITYDPSITLLSVLPAILASGLNMHIVARANVTLLRLIGGGIIFGGGIGFMHYTGMAAIEFNAFLLYDPWLFTASIQIAVLLAIAALWVGNRMVRRGRSATLASEIGAAVLIGLAVSGMHYTAMSSTLCFASDDIGSAGQAIDPDILAGFVLLAATMVLIAGIGAAIYDRRLLAANSERERAARKARDIDRQMTDAVETMPGALALFDAEGKLITYNSQFRRTYHLGENIDAEDFILDDAIPDDALHDETAADDDTDGDWQQPLFCEPAPGQWSMIRRRQVADGGTVFLRTDITAVKQAEGLLKRQERRLQLIMDNVADAVMTLGKDGIVKSANRATRTIFGYAPNEIVGTHISNLLGNNATGTEQRDLIRYLLDLHDAPGNGDVIELTAVDKKDNVLYLEAVFSEVDEDGMPMFIGAFRDITERKLSAIELQRAKDQAEQANNAKSDFISHMSHDLRTPLNAVIGMTEALTEIDALRKDDEQLVEYLSNIHASGTHLLSLVNDILDLSAIESGGRSMNFEAFDPDAVLADILQPIGNTLMPGITVTLNTTPNTLAITADKQSFRQVTFNLIGNALEHGGQNVTVDIETGTDETGKFVFVAIQDDGPGIPNELVEKLGQPFPETHTAYISERTTNAAQGAGLGLYIVSQLMMQNNGRLNIESTLGRGTTARCYWPISLMEIVSDKDTSRAQAG